MLSGFIQCHTAYMAVAPDEYVTVLSFRNRVMGKRPVGALAA
jgi:hypothetical protein